MTDVVVFPTPPFWFTTDKIFATLNASEMDESHCRQFRLPTDQGTPWTSGKLGETKLAKQDWFHKKPALTCHACLCLREFRVKLGERHSLRDAEFGRWPKRGCAFLVLGRCPRLG
ncbi:hypothetical protein RE6C_00868 [Rhodopirellula europaea 6C]|uniref:Uncharacterized protein n=1 Tax=Rhodopirellula europaea 6C TaxID=1263867 RepID=M2B0K3_9BACT|nr:hypothetical protein RE6C_00868 [Rhodopirellula europaea 6C]